MVSPMDLLVDAFDRIRSDVHGALEDLTEDQLAVRLDPDANSIAWLVWHLTRVQDDHVAGLAQRDQQWTAGDWITRFGLPFGTSDIGYGHSSADVAEVRAGAGLLLDYYDDVHEHTVGYLRTLTAEDLERVVDERWDPPVTVAIRLVSVVNDATQHAGQAAFVRGILVRGVPVRAAVVHGA